MKGEVLGLFITVAVFFWILNLQVCRSHHETCDRIYSKVNCIDTLQNHNRIYEELILTDRDKKSVKSSGIPTDWFHWEEYLLGLVCRCMERLNRLSDGNLSIYNQFAIENYGECWSRRHGYDSLDIFIKSNNCIGAGYLECQLDSMGECSGMEYTSFIYQVHNRTKLLDEHCKIVKRIVCPSSTISLLHNSSTPFQKNATVFGNFTNTQQYPTAQLLRSSTVLINTTNTKQYTSSQVLRNSTKLMDSQTIRLKASSLYATFNKSTSKIFSNRTDSMLSQLQTLNTGELYTSGSKLENMTLAPTQFFITSSIRYTAAATMLSNVESTRTYSNHTGSLTLARSSETTLPISSNAKQIASKSYHISNNASFVTQLSVNQETTLQTSRLHFALSTINTSPIKETSILASQSTLQQNLSTSESIKKMLSTHPDTMLLSSLSSRQLNITPTTTGNVTSLLLKSRQSNTSEFIFTKQKTYSHLPVDKSPEVTEVLQSSFIISTSIHNPEISTSSPQFTYLYTLSTVLSGKLTELIQPSYMKSSFQWYSNTSGERLISTSLFGESYQNISNYSSIKQSETKMTGSQFTHANVVSPLAPLGNKTLFTSIFKKSSITYLNSVYPTTLLNETPISTYIHPLSTLEKMSTTERSMSGQIKASNETSKVNKHSVMSIVKENSTSNLSLTLLHVHPSSTFKKMSTMERSMLSQIKTSYEISSANKPSLTSIIKQNSTIYLSSTPLSSNPSLPPQGGTTSTMQRSLSSQIKASYETTQTNKQSLTSIVKENSTSYLTPLNVSSSLSLEGATSLIRSIISSQIKARSEITVSHESQSVPETSNSKCITPIQPPTKRNSATTLSTIFMKIFIMLFVSFHFA